jgi:hypothetical protein
MAAGQQEGRMAAIAGLREVASAIDSLINPEVIKRPPDEIWWLINSIKTLSVGKDDVQRRRENQN